MELHVVPTCLARALRHCPFHHNCTRHTSNHRVRRDDLKKSSWGRENNDSYRKIAAARNSHALDALQPRRARSCRRTNNKRFDRRSVIENVLFPIDYYSFTSNDFEPRLFFKNISQNKDSLSVLIVHSHTVPHQTKTIGASTADKTLSVMPHTSVICYCHRKRRRTLPLSACRIVFVDCRSRLAVSSYCTAAVVELNKDIWKSFLLETLTTLLTVIRQPLSTSIGNAANVCHAPVHKSLPCRRSQLFKR